jgi:type IX secretion system PorP/SprF family membrane protein
MIHTILRKGLHKKALIASVLAMAGLSVSAQQIEEFSLFRENAVALNPAMVGSKGFLAGDLAFRKQFSQLTDAPYTAYLNMQGQVADKNFGIGGSFIHDQTGPTGKTGGTIAASYQLKLGKSYDYVNEENVHYNNENRHMICFGLSVSLMQYRLNGSALHPDQQGDPGLYTSNAYKLTPDVAFGVYYQWLNHLYAGVSVPQIMGLNVNYVGRDGNGSIKTVQHLNFLVGGRIQIVKHKFSIDPAAAFRWVQHAPPQGDIGVRLTFFDGLWVGGTYRSLNTVILDAGVEIKGFLRLAYAYDYNFSPYHGEIGATHEFSVGFRFNRDKDALKDTKFLAGIGK